MPHHFTGSAVPFTPAHSEPEPERCRVCGNTGAMDRRNVTTGCVCVVCGDKPEWGYTQHMGRHTRGLFRSLEITLAHAHAHADRTAPVGVQRFRGRMEVAWYDWDKWNRLRPVHTLPTNHADPSYED